MNEYSVSLALTYFKEKRSSYVIGELAEILGYNRKQILELVEYLLSQNYINYVNNLLTISSKGIIRLISSNCDSLSFQAESYITPHIDPKNSLPIDAPYVPVGFTKKFKK